MSPDPMPSEPTPQVPVPVPVPPDLLAWAQQTFDAEEFLAGVHEIQATGGKPLELFIAAVEAAARKS